MRTSGQAVPPPATVAADGVKAFAVTLLRLRKQRQWTQRDLASRAGLTAATVSSVERGLNCPRLYCALALAQALGTTVDDMVGGAVAMREDHDLAAETGGDPGR